MIEDLPDVPPALLLLLRETAVCTSWSDARRRIRGMLTDLRDQSEAYEFESVKRLSDTRDPTRFEVHLHGGLDLLSRRAGCVDLRCRLQMAERIARSVGLIADRVWMTDYLSGRFVNFGRATNEKLDTCALYV